MGAAAMLGAAMQAPLTGLALILEPTAGGFPLMIPMVAATVTATAAARRIDGYFIYTARLRARPRPAGTSGEPTRLAADVPSPRMTASLGSGREAGPAIRSREVTSEHQARG